MATRLSSALTRLVDEGVLTATQALAVIHAVDAQPDPDVVTQGHEPQRGAAGSGALSWGTRLLEAAVYLGIAFVIVAVGIIIGTNWSQLRDLQRILLTGGLTVAALLAGLVTAGMARRDLRSNRSSLGTTQTIQRASTVLMTASAALAAWTAYVVLRALNLPDTGWGPPIIAVVGLAMMIVAHLVAPSVLTEIGLFVATIAVALTVLQQVIPEPGPEADWSTRGSLIGGGVGLVAAAWAWGVSRLLTNRMFAAFLGLIAAIVATMSMGGPDGLHAKIAASALAVAALLTYLRTSELPWIIGAILAATVVVFRIAGDTLDQAVAFLIAGLVLLAGVAIIAVLRRRRTTPHPVSAG